MCLWKETYILFCVCVCVFVSVYVWRGTEPEIATKQPAQPRAVQFLRWIVTYSMYS